MVEKDYKHLVGGIKRVSLTLSPSAANPLYGTKILNLKTQEIGLLICLWENKYSDKTVDCLGFFAWLSAFNEFALFCLRKTSATLSRQSAPRSQSFAIEPSVQVCPTYGLSPLLLNLINSVQFLI